MKFVRRRRTQTRSRSRCPDRRESLRGWRPTEVVCTLRRKEIPRKYLRVKSQRGSTCATTSVLSLVEYVVRRGASTPLDPCFSELYTHYAFVTRPREPATVSRSKKVFDQGVGRIFDLFDTLHRFGFLDEESFVAKMDDVTEERFLEAEAQVRALGNAVLTVGCVHPQVRVGGGENRAQFLETIKILIAHEVPVYVCVCVRRASQTRIDVPASKYDLQMKPYPGTRIDSHLLCLVGFDDARGEFTYLNSWDRDWGASGYGRLPYRCILNLPDVGRSGAKCGYFVVGVRYQGVEYSIRDRVPLLDQITLHDYPFSPAVCPWGH